MQNPSEIAALAAALANETIDVLVHCAAVAHGDLASVMRVNAEAPLHVAEALLPMVRRSHRRTIAFLTSTLGSRTWTGLQDPTQPMYIYAQSKRELNDVGDPHHIIIIIIIYLHPPRQQPHVLTLFSPPPAALSSPLERL
jgi:Dehydrogenases with different specificities (related to short-chain alcohol dehydrogenases)